MALLDWPFKGPNCWSDSQSLTGLQSRSGLRSSQSCRFYFRSNAWGQQTVAAAVAAAVAEAAATHIVTVWKHVTTWDERQADDI